MKKRNHLLTAATLTLAGAALASGPAQTQPAASTPKSATATPSAGQAPGQAPAPTAAPVASPAPAPATTPPSGRTIRFQFDGMPYVDVIHLFAQMAGKPVVGDVQIDGTLTFFDSEPYTYQQAFDTLNTILAMRGYALMEDGRFLQLVPLTQVPKMPLPILKGLDQAEGVPPGQIVTVVLPLKFLPADSAAKTLAPLVSSFGTVAPLGKGKGVIITDRLSNIQRVRGLLNQLDTQTLVEQQIRTYKLKAASARQVADVINNLFGAEAKGGARTMQGENGAQVKVEGLAICQRQLG